MSQYIDEMCAECSHHDTTHVTPHVKQLLEFVENRILANNYNIN